MLSAGTNVAIAIASGLFVFSIIVFIHEMGHFLAARSFGVKIDAFSIGFGPTLVSWRDRHDTVWRVAAVPLGGYVKFFGDASAASAPDRTHLAALQADMAAEHGRDAAEGCFHFKPVWQRAVVVAAGPAANFVLSIVIFAGLALALGGQPQLGLTLEEVRAESPAAAAGLEPGDTVLAADARPLLTFQDLQQYVVVRGGETVVFTLERDGAQIDLPATLGRAEREGPLDRPVEVGYLGVTPVTAQSNWVRFPVGPFGAVREGVAQTWGVVETTGLYVARMVSGKESFDQLGGVPRIAAIAGDTAQKSYASSSAGGGPLAGLGAVVVNLIHLAALLSVGVGLLNLLPVPVLDGGHLVYYAYEAVAGRPLGEATQEWGFRVGLALVLGLMLFVTLNDLRFFARA